MAIIQISKIQQRSGNLVDLPQLDEAQFGWATDAKRLFIGKTSPNENIEVLTSYSNISFSQIDGSDGGNFNISNATNGQVLTYVDSTNTWENWPSTDILTANANFKLNLGDVGNIKMTGGATGYVLETDGTGNLAWTSKGTLRVVINNLQVDTGNANILVMTVPNTTPYTNSTEITISGAVATSANTIVNGLTFYTKVDANFAYNGIVTLYENANLFTPSDGTGLGTYTANSGLAVTSLSSGAVSNAEGSVNSIQYNDSGVLNGSANFTITGGNLVTLTGNFNASNVNGGNLVSANFVSGTLTTSSQPNITSTGTLAGLVVAGNITPSANVTYNLGNNTNRFNDLYLAGSTVYIGNQTISANTTSVVISGTLIANIVGNVVGNVTTAGTVTDAAQPNITSVGTLTSLSVSGNANIGNIGTAGLITATGNITGANIVGTHYGAATGLTSIPGANVTGAVSYATTANAVAGANVSGTVANATYAVSAGTANSVTAGNISGTVNLANFATTANAVAGANVSGAVSFATTANVVAGANVSGAVSFATTANAVAGANVSGAVSFATTANAVAGANVSGTVANATYAVTAGTANSVAGANVSGTVANATYAVTAGTAYAVSAGNISGTINLANFATTANSVAGSNVSGAVAYASTANSVAGANVSGQVTYAATANSVAVANVSGIGNIATINKDGNASNILYGNGVFASAPTPGVSYGNSNVATFLASYGSNTITTTGNITAGNLSLGTGSATLGTLTTGSNTTVGTITGNFSLSTGSRLNATYADLAEYYEADKPYDPGTVVEFGGPKEVTIAEDGTTRVAGVVSTNPAYVMNSQCKGDYVVALALQGRVPCKIRGIVRKGDMLVSAGEGYARPMVHPYIGSVIGKALENFEGIEGVIEVAIGRL